ncbi:hypothetical protein [Specibacter cremeus]|uniref:hypothetical protein n=1 Tax=Specibacter cremeus TaxID=1629051 RepID=UPI000F7B442C|nr:hypothetical protein [Specibacter cremeus]
MMEYNTGAQSPALSSATPAAATTSYVALDGFGNFSYYSSEESLIKNFEIRDDFACILDRKGGNHRIFLDESGLPRLCPYAARVEFHWLRQEWRNAQLRNIRQHPLRRFLPTTQEALLVDMFEVLELEQSANTPGRSWTTITERGVSHQATLNEVYHELGHRRLWDEAVVRDPFGHSYRPHRRRLLPPLATTTGTIYLIEIPPRG